jgi:GNAT superfamily N-acetyltransferase
LKASTTIEIEEWSAAEVLRRRHDFGTIYRDAFASYPYYTPEHVARQFVDDTLPTHSTRRDFRCVVARDTTHDMVVGFSYGYTGEPGQWWREAVASALDDQTAAHWLRDYFEFVELAVAPSSQGRGIGGRIHDTLLAGVRQPRAMLSTHAVPTPARHMYDRRGWVVLRDNFRFPSASHPFTIMGLEL